MFNVNDYKCPDCGCFNLEYNDYKLTCKNCGGIVCDYVHNCPCCGSSNLTFKNMELTCYDCALIIPPNNFKSSYEIVNDEGRGLPERLNALDRIDNDNVLWAIVLDSSLKDIKIKACSKIKNQRILKSLALNHPDSTIRSTACRKISDGHVLAQLDDDEDENISRNAMDRIADDDILKDIFLTHEDIIVGYSVHGIS